MRSFHVHIQREFAVDMVGHFLEGKRSFEVREVRSRANGDCAELPSRSFSRSQNRRSAQAFTKAIFCQNFYHSICLNFPRFKLLFFEILILSGGGANWLVCELCIVHEKLFIARTSCPVFLDPCYTLLFA